MKKLYAFLFTSACLFCSAQCTILGNDYVEVGEKQNYSIDGNFDNAAFNWEHNDQKIIFESPTTIPIVELKGAVPGDALIQLKIHADNSERTCEKMIKVIPPTDNSKPRTADCLVNLSGIKEVKTAAGTVVFEAEPAGIEGKYVWTIHYRNGQKKVSNEKSATINYTMDQVISSVDLQINSNVCMKKFTKNYHDNFWYFF